MTEVHVRLNLHRFFRILFFISILTHHVSSSEYDTLMKLKNSLKNGDKLTTWKSPPPPCSGNVANWDGVRCVNDTVWGIRLEGKDLGGKLNTDILMGLPSLITISFQNNRLEGEFPEFKKLPRLRAIFLTANKFSGVIPADAFEGMRRLKKLYLANNDFEGRIPLSLTTLPKLRDLMLENNRFEGEIPVFVRDNLTILNFANNRLNGPIPKRLQQFPASQFSGNGELCGPPLAPCEAETSTATIIVIALVVVAAMAAIITAFIILQKFGPSSTDVSPVSACKKGTSFELEIEHGCGNPAAKKVESMKLIFLRDDGDDEKFDLADLLKASAEILGSGVFGSSYKATLTNRRVVVVKRFKEMNNVTEEEFVKHLRRLGKLNHPNLVPLIAFYYRKEEKLFVTSYAEKISLAVHLHGNRGGESRKLDWATRLKIVKGVGRGLLHLYNELPSLIAPHGHLKSSNVLLDGEFEPLLTDYGLVPIVNQEHAREVMIAFKSPEYKKHRRITKKTDIWSLGVLILEIMTGMFPANSFHQGKGGDTDVMNFVDSVIKEDLATHIFEKEIGGFSKQNEPEMTKLLKIGMTCCEPDVGKRWDIKQVVDRIEEVREKSDDINNDSDSDDE